MNGGAMISGDRQYRYVLYRMIADCDPARVLVMVGHNPSTADDTEDDNTIRRVISFARMYRYGMVVMLNLFAFRATNPEDVPTDDTAIGNGNDDVIRLWFGAATKICCAWGTIEHELKVDRIDKVCTFAEELGKHLWCLGMTKNGSPRHPLYLPGDTTFIPWRPGFVLREGWSVTDRNGEPVWYYYTGRVWVVEVAGYWQAYRATGKPMRNAAFWTADNVRCGHVTHGYPTLEAAMIAAEECHATD